MNEVIKKIVEDTEATAQKMNDNISMTTSSAKSLNINPINIKAPARGIWGCLLHWIKKWFGKDSTVYNETSTSDYPVYSCIQTWSQDTLSAIEEINSLWETQTSNNKDQLLRLIDNSELPANDKFKASMLITVTKTLNFETLKILNIIDGARSLSELQNNADRVACMLKEKVDDVSKRQIDAYIQADKILRGEKVHTDNIC